MSKNVLFFALALATGLVGCKNQEAAEPAAPAAESAGAEAEAAPGAAPRLTLLEPGAEPRRALRYNIEEGTTESIRIEMVMGLSSVIGEVVAEVEQAPTRFVFSAGPTRSSGEDRITYDLSITEVEVMLEGDVDEEMQEMIRETINPLTELSGWVEVNTQGRVMGSSMNIPPEMSARTRTALSNIFTSLVTVPLPSAEVGVGARWKIERMVQLPSLQVQQTVTYTLAELEGDIGRLDVTIQQSAAPQPLPGLEEGESGIIEAYESAGVGSVSVDMTRLVPVSEADVTTQMRAVIETEGATVPMSLRMRSVVQAYSVE